MSLANGTRLGAYEITGPIGAGGMGEVYRATDSKLGREVAIKTLPEGMADDAERLARFEREAKLLASLNHAHIASIYSLDEHAGTLYLAMELIDGETLETRLKARPLQTGDALALALQIAEGLEAAHSKGVVHRDLKPANIMVTADGVVKILDFGLAKAFAGTPGEASPAHSPALSMAMTQQGLMLGTAGYMSPEQACGQATDQRADVWAFGVVLYEMLTGLPVFAGESVPHVLAAVLQTEPDWKRLPDDADPRIRQLLERCLAKKPRSRYHSIADVRIDIEAILQDPLSGSGYLRQDLRRGFAATLRLVAVVVGVAAVAAYAGWLVREPDDSSVVRRFEYVLPEDQAFPTRIPTNTLSWIALFSDGNKMVYAANQQLYLRDFTTESFNAVPIAGTDELPAVPVMSPDDLWVAFFSNEDRQIKKIRIEGGVPIPLVDAAVPHGMSWNADGILYAQRGGIYQVSADGGDARLIIATEEGEQAGHPQLLPDGQTVLFSLATGDSFERWNAAEIFVSSLDGDNRVALGLQGSAARYVPTGHITYFVGQDLFAVPFDIEGLQTVGGPVAAVPDINRFVGNVGQSPSANYSFSDSGSLIYVPASGAGAAEGQIMTVSREGFAEPLTATRRDYLLPRVDPNGTRVAVQATDSTSDTSYLRMIDLETGADTQFTFESAQRPIWTADSEFILYRVFREGGSAIMMRRADGTGSAELVYEGMDLWPTSISPGGVVAFYEVNREINDRDILMFDIDTAELSTFLATENNERNPRFSPDGQWVAYVSDESGSDEIWIRPAPGFEGPERIRVSEGGGSEPAWSADGNEIYFLDSAGNLMVAQILRRETLTPLPPQSLFPINRRYRIDFSATWTSYDVLPNGRFVMVSIDDGTGGDQRIAYVESWFEELRRLAPAD